MNPDRIKLSKYKQQLQALEAIQNKGAQAEMRAQMLQANWSQRAIRYVQIATKHTYSKNVRIAMERLNSTSWCCKGKLERRVPTNQPVRKSRKWTYHLRKSSLQRVRHSRTIHMLNLRLEEWLREPKSSWICEIPSSLEFRYNLSIINMSSYRVTHWSSIQELIHFAEIKNLIR